jgi:Transcription factor WhiB
VATPRYHVPTVTSDAYEHSVVRWQVTVFTLLQRYTQPEPWWPEARCHGEGVDRWFPGPERKGPAPLELRQTCAECPVDEQCRQAGQAAWDGVWAGRVVRRNRDALPNIATRGPLALA